MPRFYGYDRPEYERIGTLPSGMCHPDNLRVKLVITIVKNNPGIKTREIASYLRMGEQTVRGALVRAAWEGKLLWNYDRSAQGWPTKWYPSFNK